MGSANEYFSKAQTQQREQARADSAMYVVRLQQLGEDLREERRKADHTKDLLMAEQVKSARLENKVEHLNERVESLKDEIKDLKSELRDRDQQDRRGRRARSIERSVSPLRHQRRRSHSSHIPWSESPPRQRRHQSSPHSDGPHASEPSAMEDIN